MVTEFILPAVEGLWHVLKVVHGQDSFLGLPADSVLMLLAQPTSKLYLLLSDICMYEQIISVLFMLVVLMERHAKCTALNAESSTDHFAMERTSIHAVRSNEYWLEP